MKILITGGTTWFGQSIVQTLINRGHEVATFDEVPAPWKLEIEKEIRIHQGSVADIGALMQAVREERPDAIIHREVLYGAETEERYLKTVKVNLIGALNVFEVAALREIQRVVYESSIGVYGVQGDHGDKTIVEEDELFQNPEHVFRLTQHCTEFFARRYQKQTGIKIVGTRPSVCHSPLKDKGVSRWSNDFVSLPAIGKPMHFPYPAEQRSSLIWVGDAAEVYARLADTPNLKYNMYNSGGYDVSNKELADMVKSFIPDAMFSYENDGIQPMPCRVSNDRAREDLDLELRPLPETLREHAIYARKLYGLPPL
jgi:nucleoside-diphosphate-sugar epimerase